MGFNSVASGVGRGIAAIDPYMEARRKAEFEENVMRPMAAAQMGMGSPQAGNLLRSGALDQYGPQPGGLRGLLTTLLPGRASDATSPGAGASAPMAGDAGSGTDAEEAGGQAGMAGLRDLLGGQAAQQTAQVPRNYVAPRGALSEAFKAREQAESAQALMSKYITMQDRVTNLWTRIDQVNKELGLSVDPTRDPAGFRAEFERKASAKPGWGPLQQSEFLNALGELSTLNQIAGPIREQLYSVYGPERTEQLVQERVRGRLRGPRLR